MYDSILERVDDLGQAFYDFGEKLKDLFSEKMASKPWSETPVPHSSSSITPGFITSGISPNVFDSYLDFVTAFCSSTNRQPPSSS